MNTRIPAGRGNPPTKEPPTDNNRKVKGRVEATLTHLSTYLEVELNSEEITQNKQLNKSKRKASKPCTHRRTSSKTPRLHLQNRIQEAVDRVTLS